MLVFLALGNAKVLSFALGDATFANGNDFALQWNIGLRLLVLCFCLALISGAEVKVC